MGHLAAPVQLDPENAEYRRDLAVSHAKLGGVYEQAGEPGKAKAAYLKVVEIFEKMKADGVLAPADEGFYWCCSAGGGCDFRGIASSRQSLFGLRAACCRFLEAACCRAMANRLTIPGLPTNRGTGTGAPATRSRLRPTQSGSRLRAVHSLRPRDVAQQGRRFSSRFRTARSPVFIGTGWRNWRVNPIRVTRAGRPVLPEGGWCV